MKSNSKKSKPFHFKQFTLYQDQCGMKISSVACVFGAWAEIQSAEKILDIGTGTGLLAMMAAQRSSAKIWAVELEENAANQAKSNVENSIFKERITIIQGDILQLTPSEFPLFEAIICNPPFFEKSSQSNDFQRNTARHLATLSPEKLLSFATNQLTEEGKIFLLLAADNSKIYEKLLTTFSFYEVEKCEVWDNPNSNTPFCVMLQIQKKYQPLKISRINLHNLDRSYSIDFQALLKDFLIIF